MNYNKQLRQIVKATGWSQERLARELDVSFPALNAWLNEKAKPRAKAIGTIERLYVQVIGSDDVAVEELQALKSQALSKSYDIKALLADKQALDTLTLYLTYHTNTIEGSTMTISDVQDVIFDNKVLSNRTLIEQTEAKNHQSALHWLLDRIASEGKDFVIDEGLILGLHVRLMNGIISNSGQYRRHSVRIMGANVSLANWQKIPKLIEDFTDTLKNNSSDLVRSLAESHATFEQIHPFSDGNGRTGRLLLLAQALCQGVMPPLVLKERKSAYYKYLEKAQKDNVIEPLELFIAEAIIQCAELLGDKNNHKL